MTSDWGPTGGPAAAAPHSSPPFDERARNPQTRGLWSGGPRGGGGRSYGLAAVPTAVLCVWCGREGAVHHGRGAIDGVQVSEQDKEAPSAPGSPVGSM